MKINIWLSLILKDLVIVDEGIEYDEILIETFGLVFSSIILSLILL